MHHLGGGLPGQIQTEERDKMPRLNTPSRWALCPLVLCSLAFATAAARGAVLSGWGLETGFSAATLTEGVPGNFTTTTPSGNACPRALLPATVAFTNVGDFVQLSGQVTLQNAPGNQQFRFGLWDTNGHTTGTLGSGVWTGADPNGWLGYMSQIGGGGGSDSVKGRNATGAWLSNTGAYEIGAGPGGQTSPPAATPYDFTLSLTRQSATNIKVDYSFVGGSVNRIGSFTDNLGTSTGLDGFDAVGFLLNGNTGSASFSNVQVVPEPASLGLLVLAAAALMRRRTTA
jgi:hypothetical protein